MAPLLPCPFCGKPLDGFHADTEDARSGGVRVLTYVHPDQSRCQIRVPLVRAAGRRAPAREV